MARAKKKKAPPRVGQLAKATSKRKVTKKATRKTTKAKPRAKKKTTRRTRPRSAEAIMRAASKEKRTTRFRYDKEGNIVGFYVPLKHQTKAEQKKATKAMVAACSAGALRQGWSPRVSCSYRTTPTEAGAGLAYARWGFPKGYRKPKHISNPGYTVRGLTVKTFKDEDGDWGFAVYSPMGEPLAIGSGEPSEKVAAREGKSEAKFQAEILEAEGVELRRGNPYPPYPHQRGWLDHGAEPDDYLIYYDSGHYDVMRVNRKGEPVGELYTGRTEKEAREGAQEDAVRRGVHSAIIWRVTHDNKLTHIGRAGLSHRRGNPSAKGIWAQLHAEFPDWPMAELKQAAGSVSPHMSAEARRVQKRYQQLRGKKNPKQNRRSNPKRVTNVRSLVAKALK